MQRSEVRALFESGECSIARTVALIGDQWSMLILREAFYGVSRFEDFRGNLLISRAVLTARLDGLVGSGLLEKADYREPGQRVRYEYRLTEAGAELIPAFVALLQWGDRHCNGGKPPVIMTHAGCGSTVSSQLRCAKGHDVMPLQVEPEPGPGLRDGQNRQIQRSAHRPASRTRSRQARQP